MCPRGPSCKGTPPSLSLPPLPRSQIPGTTMGPPSSPLHPPPGGTSLLPERPAWLRPEGPLSFSPAQAQDELEFKAWSPHPGLDIPSCWTDTTP